MLGLRRVSFQMAFIGLGCRRRASVERWWERSTDIAMEEEATDIAGDERIRQLSEYSIYRARRGDRVSGVEMLGKAVDDGG